MDASRERLSDVMDDDELRRQYIEILREVGIERADDAVIAFDEDAGTMMAATRSEDGPGLRVRRDTFDRIVTDADLLQMGMRHEACHLAVSPTFDVPVREGTPLQVQTNLHYLDLYREYIAHQEYLRRFGASFDPLAAKLFAPASAWEDTNRQVRAAGGAEGTWILHVGIFRIFYDAIYLELVGRSDFRDWCQAAGLSGLYRLFRLVMDDMRVIHESERLYADQLEMMNDSLKFACMVDLEVMLHDGKLVLLRPVAEVPDVDPLIAARWRRNGLQVRR